MTEHFFDAALRHYTDACILLQNDCPDNAVCLFANSAECVLKSLIEVYIGQNNRSILQYGYGHKGTCLLNDLYLFISNSFYASLLNPALGLKLYDFLLPDMLFHEHPERRYAETGRFNSQDSSACKSAAEFLIQEMIEQSIDGYL